MFSPARTVCSIEMRCLNFGLIKKLKVVERDVKRTIGLECIYEINFKIGKSVENGLILLN